MSGIEQANGHKPLSLWHVVDPNIANAKRPDPAEYDFDLAGVLGAVVQLRSQAPEDAFSSSYLGTEREGNAVLLDDEGLYLTIGYLVTEAETVLLGSEETAVTPAHVVAYDYETGFGLLRAARPLPIAPIALGTSAALSEKGEAIVAARGGLGQAIKIEVVSKREFAGYWEYLLEEAIFTSPPHPHWSGSGLIDSSGRLIGIGSLFVQDARPGGSPGAGNMFVPIDLYKQVAADLLTHGRRPGPRRPWLGIYSIEALGRVLVTSISKRGPAADAGLEPGDVVLAVNGEDVGGIAEMYRKVWQTGPAGVRIELRVLRESRVVTVGVVSTDRERLMKSPSAH